MYSKELIIVKLGGSVITFKDDPLPKLRTRVVKLLGQEIKQIIDTNKYELILVHGAGSYGHPLAKKYNLQHGMKTKEQKYGFGLTDAKMIELNLTILNLLLQAGVTAVSISPHSFTKQASGKMIEFDPTIIQGFLKQGLTPILFGDGVLDESWGCSILSGDTIVSNLAKHFKVSRIIFLSDVDGIFDRDPKNNPKAKLIPEVTNKNLDNVLQGLTSTSRDDVTGEMYGKITAIQNQLSGIPVFLTNGLKIRALTRAVVQDLSGTRLHFD